jgi:hypothetical protein
MPVLPAAQATQTGEVPPPVLEDARELEIPPKCPLLRAQGKHHKIDRVAKCPIS